MIPQLIRFLTIAYMSIAVVPAQAQEVHILADVSNSTGASAHGVEISPFLLFQSAVRGLGDDFVYVVPWRGEPLDPLFGSGAEVASTFLIPLPAPLVRPLCF